MRRVDRFRYRAFAFVGALLAMLLAGCGRAPVEHAGGQTFAQAVGVEGFEPVVGPRQFEFPRDHGPHRDQRIEWWYYTGNVASSSGRRFGFQVTFFRVGLRRDSTEQTGSTWRADDMYIGHVALTDVENRRYFHEERTQRAALGLAGAQADPHRVWLEGWTVSGEQDGRFAISVDASEFGLHLLLEQSKPVVLQGDKGLSTKGPDAGEASYYYSIPRLETTGSIVLDGEKIEISGTAWLDREWTSAVLARGLDGWDWFGLQFESGEDLMLYRLRGKDDESSAWSGGSWVDRKGQATHLTASDIVMIPKDRVNVGARSYPLSWKIELPRLSVRLETEAQVNVQEFAGFVRYWEGAVNVAGARDGDALSGVGYMELTGY